MCDNYPKISIAVESKWIGATKPTIKSVIWDLIRLEIIANSENARCFFILGGKKSDLEHYFALKPFSDSGTSPVRKPLLRHDNNLLHTTRLVPLDKIRIPILKEIFADYQDFDFPHKIITRRSAPFPNDAKAGQFQVYAWEVLSAGKR